MVVASAARVGQDTDYLYALYDDHEDGVCSRCIARREEGHTFWVNWVQCLSYVFANLPTRGAISYITATRAPLHSHIINLSSP